jgi:hypothetical protein
MSHEIILQGFLIKNKIQISTNRAEEIRNQNISNQIWAGLQSAILGGGAAALHDSISKGFAQGREQIKSIENSIDYRAEYFQYGNIESISKIYEIEADPNFDKWIDEIAIEDLKKSISL